MKKTFFAAALAVSALCASAQEGKQNVFKANIFSPVVKTGSFFYERVLSPKSSFQLGVGFTAFNRDEVKINGIFITPEYRAYLSENNSAPQGFYVAPFLRYQNLTIKDDMEGSTDKATLSTFGGGVVIGRQWIFSNIVSLDLFAGPSYNSGEVKVKSGDVEDVPGTFQGFGVRAGVTLGVAF